MKLRKGHTSFRSDVGLKRFVFKLSVAAILVGVIGVCQGNEIYAADVACNPGATNIGEAKCMQDMNWYVKQSMEVGTEYTLIDKRDESEYTIALLKDGNVWLLDNLKIGAEVDILLTSEDTNTDPDLNGGVFELPLAYGGENSYTTPVAYSGISRQIVPDSGEDWEIGGYYNYCAASAGTYCDEDGAAEGDAMYDICPAGWRMPTGGVGGEYQTVVSMYDNPIDVLHLPLSGRYYDNDYGRIGEDGYFWSSTNRDGRRMYYLNRSGDSVAPTGSYRRDRGYSMRCVAKVEKPAVSCNSSAKNIDEAVCMQDMNAMVKESMEVDTEYLLVDSRDQEEYTVAKLQDGNVWLLDNLRLGKEEEMLLTSEDTNISGQFTLPASGYWENSFTEPMIDTSRKDRIDDASDGWKAGGYYNYCAASAGTYCEETGVGDAEYDICPAKWRMPTGGMGAGEYLEVVGLYDDPINTLRLPLSGRYYNSSVGYNGQDGYFWSSTGNNDIRMYGLNREKGEASSGGMLTSGTGKVVDPEFKLERNRGYSIRCVVNIKEEGEGGYRWKNGINRHVKGSDGGLTFLIDLSPEAVVSVKVDGVELDSDDYEILNEGGTAILLKKNYVDSIEAKTHQLTVEYESGTVVETEFIVEEASEEDIPVPNTGIVSGESSYSKSDDLVIYVVMGAMVSIVLGFVAARRIVKKIHSGVDFS